MAKLATPQLSELPLSMSAAVMVPFPLPSRYMVTPVQTALGLTESRTVTVEVQVPVLLLPSATVRVTELAPTLLQVNEEVLGEKLLTEQLSVLPPSRSALVMVAFPLPSR